jgi:Zn-dependent M32 family carboxypeptidase
MTVQYTGVSQLISAQKVVYYNDDVIRAIAQAAMVSMAEADIDMLMDCPDEYPTKADVERVFQGLNEQATDLINDVFDDLKQRLLSELAEKRYTAQVRALHYDEHGNYDDIDVKLTFE